MPHKNIDGYVSVTQVINCLDKPWKWNWYRSAVKKTGYQGWLACDEQSRVGRENGSEFHSEVEGYLLDRKPMEKFKVWQKWYDSIGLEPLLVEPKEPFKDPFLMLQGTPDYIAYADKKPVVWDWKFSKVISDDYGLQLAAYTYLYGLSTGLSNDSIWQLMPYGMIGWLNKETMKMDSVRFNNLKKYWKVFKGLIDGAHYLNKSGEWEEK